MRGRDRTETMMIVALVVLLEVQAAWVIASTL